MASSVDERNIKRLSRVRRDYRRSMITGRLLSDGSVSNPANLGAPTGKTWVRTALNARDEIAVWGVRLTPNVNVEIDRYPNGEYFIVGADIARGTVTHGVLAETLAKPADYADATGISISANGVLIGRLGASESGGTYVHVEPFEYNGARYAPADTDVAAYYPGADFYGRIGAYFNPSTGELVFFAGSNDTDLALLQAVDDRGSVPTGMLAIGAVIVASDSAGDPVAITNTNPFESWRNFLSPNGHLLTGDAVTRTIASGAVTLSSESHLIAAAESGTADDLATLTFGSSGNRLLLVQADTGDTITLKHGTGNISLYGSADVDITGDQVVLLQWDGTTALQVGGSGGGGGGALDDLTDVDAPSPSDSDVLMFSTSSGNWENAALPTPSGGMGDYILIRDEKTSGTAGGTFTSGAWRTRDLNTEVVDTGSHASISSNQITLAAGTYRARISCPAYAVNAHQSRLYNITDGAVVSLGQNIYGTTGAGGASTIAARFTIASSKVLEVQHYCTFTGSSNGFGVPLSIGTEVYTIVELWRE